MDEQHKERNNLTSWKRNFNIGVWLARIHMLALVHPSRRMYGKRTLGTPCAQAAALIFLWGMFARDMLVWAWGALWLCYQIKHKLENRKAAQAAIHIPTESEGVPVEAMRYCKDEHKAKLIVEPILVGILGGVMYWIYLEMGWRPTGLPSFLLTGLFTLPLVESVRWEAW